MYENCYLQDVTQLFCTSSLKGFKKKNRVKTEIKTLKSTLYLKKVIDGNSLIYIV